MAYFRDTSNDLVWDSTTNSYVPVIPEPSDDKPTHLYRWKKYGTELGGGTYYYTAKSILSIGDKIYTKNGIDTGRTVQYIHNNDAMSVSDCLFVFDYTPLGGIAEVHENQTATLKPNVFETTLGSTIDYKYIYEDYPVREGSLVTDEALEWVKVSATESNHSYQITYDNSIYTATPTEGVGLVITNITSTQTTVNVGSDFTVTDIGR